MDKPNETAENMEPEAPWGTWEELLLSCAVHRYGTNCWDSVAIEIQKRSSTTSTFHLTPTHCKQKYRDLKRRYSPQKDAVSAAVNKDDEADDAVPWLDTLRKLRVAELKREVERYDLSIVSLQLKVKRLEEEREDSFREDDKNGGGKSDLEKKVEGEREDEQNRQGVIEPEKSPVSIAGEPVPGDDNRSVNESNSTDAKGEDLKKGTDDTGKEPDPVPTGEGEPDYGATKPGGENSCNGSSDSIEKEENPVPESVKTQPDGRLSDSPELWESVAESKGGCDDVTAAKESSDVQSSASKSRKELEVDKVRSGCVSSDEPEDVDRSPATKRVSVESHSLVDFLEIVRSHKLGSLFERRLERQDTSEYKNLIRQHVDLETIQTRLKEGCYSSFNSKFYRDLLLLSNNAILFFGKESRESSAAIELRRLVSKEMARANLKFDSSAEEQQTPTPSSPLPLPSKPKLEPSSDSLLLKPKMISGPMIVCRKRSSIAAKALVGSSTSGGADRKREQKAEEKPNLDWKQPNKKSPVNNAEENNRATKKNSSDRFALAGSRSSKKNGKNRSNPNPSKNSEPLSSEHSEPKSEKNTPATSISGGAKKRSAANFLSRIKQGSTSTNNNRSTLLDTLKNSGVGSNMNTRGGGGGGGGGEQKRNGGNGKGGDGKKEQEVASTRRGSGGGRQTKEKEQVSPTKKSVGRPKRAAAPPPSVPAAVSGKRSREGGGGGGGKEAGASRQPKKRSRK